MTSCDAKRLKVNECEAADPVTLDKHGNLYYYLSYFGRVSREPRRWVGTMSGLFHSARTFTLNEGDEGFHLQWHPLSSFHG